MAIGTVMNTLTLVTRIKVISHTECGGPHLKSQHSGCEFEANTVRFFSRYQQKLISQENFYRRYTHQRVTQITFSN
jgi:hypothetical protein